MRGLERDDALVLEIDEPALFFSIRIEIALVEIDLFDPGIR